MVKESTIPKKLKVFGNFAKKKAKVNILKIKKTDLGLDFIHDEMSTEEWAGTEYYINSIKYMDSQEPFPNFETALNLYDEVPSEEDLQKRNIDKLLLMSRSITNDPTKYRLCSLWGLQLFDKIDKILENQVSWSMKFPKACWYGSTTGALDLWAKKPKFTRYQLVHEAKKRPDLIKAGFTYITQYAKMRPEKFRNDVMKVVEHSNSYEQMRNKYIVVADGNVSTYGFFWVLASGSVPLKQDSEYIQYFEDSESMSGDFLKSRISDSPEISDFLKPNVHYVPIKKDYSDLLEKIEWLKEHDKEAQKIAENARSFAQRHFNLEALQKQLRETLVE